MSRKKQKLPSRRNLELFMRVAIQGRTAADVAREFGLQQRVVETHVAAVRTWMRRHGAVWEEIDERIRQSSLVCELYLARLEHQWEELMNSWHRSTEPQEIKRGRFDGNKEVKFTELTTRSQTGDVSYLVQAQKLLDIITAIRLKNPSPGKEQNNVQLASVEQRRIRLHELLKLYGPGSGAAGGDSAPLDSYAEPESPGDTRAA